LTESFYKNAIGVEMILTIIIQFYSFLLIWK